MHGSGWKIDGAIPDAGTTRGPPCAAAERLAAAFPSATCSNACEPFFSMARVRFARTYRSKKTPYPARKTHLGDGLQARPIRGLTLLDRKSTRLNSSHGYI